jgi:hypothetical protein
VALPARYELPFWITFTVQFPNRKLWKVTTKPFVLEIDGTEMKGSDEGLGDWLAVGLGVELGFGDADGVGVSEGEGVTSSTGSMT